MIVFWLAIALMIGVALLFLVLPILRSSSQPIDHPALTSCLYRQRLEILKEELTRQEITPETYQHLRLELEKAALLEMPILAQDTKKTNRIQTRALLLAVFFLVALPLISLSIYFKLVTEPQFSAQHAAAQRAQEVQAEITQLGSVQNVIAILSARLQAHPDARGWFLLGKLYLKAQQYPEAVHALQEANRLQPNQPETMIAYAEALYFANQRVLTPLAQTLLEESLRLQPQQTEALNLLAVAAYQSGHYSEAVNYWQQLLPQFAPDSEDSQILLRMIANAQQKMRHDGASTPVIKLPVTVRLATSLQNKIPPQATLFIYAQAVSGPPMPLAVLRRKAADLPLAVTLDESMAMIPTMSLADFRQVKITARISLSNQAQPEAGDWSGSSSVIDTQHIPKMIFIQIS